MEKYLPAAAAQEEEEEVANQTDPDITQRPKRTKKIHRKNWLLWWRWQRMILIWLIFSPCGRDIQEAAGNICFQPLLFSLRGTATVFLKTIYIPTRPDFGGIASSHTWMCKRLLHRSFSSSMRKIGGRTSSSSSTPIIFEGFFFSHRVRGHNRALATYYRFREGAAGGGGGKKFLRNEKAP